MSGVVNYTSAFTQSVTIADVEISNTDTNLVVKNTSDSSPENVTVQVRFRDTNDANAMTLGIDNNAVELKNECTNGTAKLSSGVKSLTIDESSSLSTFNTDVKSNAMKLAGSTSGTLTVMPAAATTDYTLTLPAAQGSNGDKLENNGSGALSWSSSSSGAWSSYADTSFSNVSSCTVDLTSFRSGSNEDMVLFIKTSIHSCDLRLSKSLLATLAADYTTFEIGKYNTRYIEWQVSNSGDTLTLTFAGVTCSNVQSWTR